MNDWLEHNILLRFSNSQQVYTPSQPITDIDYKLSHLQITDTFSQIENYQRLLLVLDNKPIALIDNLSNEFWVKQNIQIMQKSELSLIPADINRVVSFKYSSKSCNLQQGLWQFVWDYVGYETPVFTKHYKLLHWPQPINCVERKSLLKISAFFMEGSSTQYISEQMHLNHNFINRYLFACHSANIIIEIPAMATVFHSQQNAIEASKPLQNFFRSLRKKLGI